MESNDYNEPFLNYKDEEKNDDLDRQIAKSIRRGFISKVYGIIIYQIILTSLVVYLAFASESFKKLLLTSVSLYYLSFMVSLVCILLPICSPRIYQSVPINYIILTIFTLSYSWMIALVTCQYTFSSVMVALFLTFITVVTLTIYAWKTKEDFTVCGGTLFVCFTLLIFSGLIFILFNIPVLNLIYTFCSLVLFSTYLIFDTQLLCGEGRVKYGEEDYILAAINIYLDAIILFLKILSIFGSKNN